MPYNSRLDNWVDERYLLPGNNLKSSNSYYNK